MNAFCCLGVACAIFFAIDSACAQNVVRYAFAEASQPARIVPRPEAAKVELELVSERMRLGEKLQIRVLITNQTGHPWRVTNPFLDRLLTPSVLAIAVFDEERAFVGDLMLRRSGSMAAIGEGSVMTVPPDGVVGRSLSLPLRKYDDEPLGPGLYYVQAILLRRFGNWEDEHPDGELARSAIQKFEIVD